MTPEQTTDYFNKVFNSQHSRITGRKYNFQTARVNNNLKDFNAAAIRAAPVGSRKSTTTKKDNTSLEAAVSANLRGFQENNDPDGLEGALMDLWGGAKEVGGALMPDQAPGAFNRALDLVSRPAYMVANAVDKMAEAINQGEEPTGVLDDTLYGAWRGLSGQDKTGFGQAVEEFARPDSTTNRTRAGNLFASGMNPFAAGLRVAGNVDEATHGEIPGLSEGIQAGKVAQGFSGELFADPLNYVGVGLVTNAVDAAKVAKNSAKYGDNLVADVVEASAKRAASKAIPSVKKRVTRGSMVNRTIAEHVALSARETVEASILNIKGGAHQGHNILATRTLIPTVVTRAANTARTALLEPFERNLARLQASKNGTGPPLTSAQRAKLAQSDPVFKSVMDDIKAQTDLQMQGKARPVNNGDIERFAQKARTLVDSQVNSIRQDMLDDLTDQFFNSPAIRVGSKRYTPPGFKKMGRAYAAVSKKGIGAPSAFSYGKAIPGRMGLINQRAKSLGARIFEAARRQDVRMARQFTYEDRKLLQEALLNNSIVPARLQPGLDYLKAEYQKIWDMEVQAGIRMKGETFADNYAYTFNHPTHFKPGQSPKEFKADRKKAIRKTGHVTMGPKEAKAMGLKPEEDAFSNLVFRRAKANRDLTRAQFTTDLVDHYGILAKNLTDEQIKLHGLKKMSKTEYINEDLMRGVSGSESWYLPKEILEVLDHYKKLSSLDFNDEALDLLRTFDWALNKFKFAATLPFPGFHFRNFVGDVFMGLLDGVTFKDYKVAGDMINHRLANRPAQQILNNVGRNKNISVQNLGGKDFTVDEIWTLFERNAGSGGYISADLQLPTGVPSKKFGEAAANAKQKIVTGSEGREDLGRFAHFFRALQDNMPTLSANPKVAQKQIDKAVQEATWRVNKYKFDYGALTATEKQYMRRIIPFYTYMRKAIPTLIESVMLSPHYLSMVHRQEEFNSEDPIYGRLADFQQQMGVLFRSGGAEPLMMSSGVLPTGVMNTIDAIDPMNPLDMDNMQDSMQSATSMLNPAAQIPVELATGTNLFSGTDVNTEGDTVGGVQIPPLIDYLAKKMIPPYSTGQQMSNNTEQGLFTDPAQFVTGSRTALGLGTYRLSKEAQVKNLMSNVYELQKKFEEEINPALEEHDAYVFVSKGNSGTSIKVNSVDGKRTLYTGDLQGALKFIKDNYDN